MKILILAVTTLNFVIYFPYNGSQEIHSQRKQHFSANPSLSNHKASNLSSSLEAEENSPTDDSNSYSALLDRIAKITGSLSEGNRLEMLQTDLQNFPPSGNDVLQSLFTNWTSVGFAYARRTVDSSTETDSPKSNASPSSDAIQDKSAVPSLPPNSQITQGRRRMPLSRESSISSSESVVHYQLELADTPDVDTDSEITQSHQRFPSIGRSEAMFASDPAAYMQNSMEKFTALADEGTIDTSNENIFLGTGITANEKTEQESVFFIDSTAPIKKGIVIPRKQFESLIDKKTSSGEESTFYTEVESESEVEVFQETEDIPSSHDLKHFELEDGAFERDAFLNSNIANSLSQFIVVPSTEITISDGDLIIPEEENVDALFVTNPTKRKIYLKPMATKTKINSLDVSTGIRQNAETGGSVAVPTPSNSIHKIESMGYSTPLNIYYDVIAKPIIAAIKDPYFTWKTIKNKQLSSTMGSGDIINLRNEYQTPSDVTAKNTDKLANKREIPRNEVRNSFHSITGVVNRNFNEDKDKIKLDLDSIIATSPKEKYIIKINDFKTLKRKPNDLGSASSDLPKVFRDEETILSNVPFNLPQATNPVKKLSWAGIMAHKTYPPNKSAITASKVGTATASKNAENILYIPRYESETSFEENTTLKYEANLQNEESIKSEEEDTLEEENIKGYIYVVPMEDDFNFKEDRLTTTHYSTNPDSYDTKTFRETIKPRAGQHGFENVISRPLLARLNPQVQRKMIATNSNSDSNHDGLFSDTTDIMIQENVPRTYTFTPETVPKFIGRDSSTPMKGNVHSGKAIKGISKPNLMASFNLVNVPKMPQNSTIISPYTSVLESKEGNDNSGTIVPIVEDIQPIGLKSLLIPRQKISRIEVPLGGKNMLSDAVVISEVSEPTEEHVISTDQNWEVIDESNAIKPFSQVSPVPLEDPMFFPEKIINIADIYNTENGNIRDDTNNMSLSPNINLQASTHKNTGINKDTEFLSHHVQKPAVSPAAEERATSGNEANAFFSNDKTVVEEKFYISGDNIPVKLEELNTMQDTPLLYKPVVASSQQKGLENSRETFYPSSTMSITKLTKVQATDSLPLGNLDHPSTNSYTKFYHIPMKMAFSSTGFIKNSKSKLDPALIIGETTTKMTDDSFIPDDILALSGNEVLSHDDAVFTEGLSNILGGGKHVASTEKSNMTSYGVISFMEDSSAESHGEFQVGENKVNNMDLTTIDLDQSTLECLSNENAFYDGEEGKSPTIRKPTDIQGVLYRGIGSPLPFPSTHVTENPSEKNPVEPKYEQKYKVWFLRGRNSDSDNNGAFVQDLPAPFYNKPPKYMATHFLTIKNGKFFSKYSEDFTLKGDSMSRSEGGDTENIHTSDSEPMTAVGERRGFPSKTTGPTMKSTTGTGIKQLPGKRLSSTAFNVLWEAKATMSPKSEYNKNKASRTETYNSEDTTVPSFPVIINPDSRVPFAYDYSEAIILKESSSSSHIKKTNTATAITSLSPEERNEWSGAMPPDENARSGEYPLLRTTESMNICLEELTMDSALMSDKCLTDSSNLEPVPTDINEYIDLMDETDHQGSQVIRLQTGLYSLTLNSSFPHKTSANVIRKSINNHVDSSSTMERQNIMAEMPHSQDSHMPLAEFGVISNDEFSFIDDSEDLSNMASLPLSPMNAMQTLDNAIILATDSIYEGESMVPGDDYNSFQASLALQSSAKHGVVPDVSTEYLESSDPIASDFFTNTPAEWSDMFETTDYINFMNDEETVVIANSNVPFILPQATNSLKKLSWTPPMGHKTYPPNMSTTKASKVGMTVADHCAENILYIPRYESETSFEEDTTLNYEANLQNEESTKSEEEDTLEEENIKDYIYVVPVEDDYILKEDRLSTTHYSTNPDAHDTTTFRETIKPRAGQHGFENVISRPLLVRLNAQVQRKMIATNSNSDSNHDGLFSDTTDRMLQENVPRTYNFTLETVPKFIRRDSSTPMKGNVHSGKAMKGISKPNLMASFNLVNIPKMPQNSIIISPYTSVLESKEGNDNSGTTVPIVEDIQPIGLKSLLIPRQKISRIEVPLGGKYMLSDTAVMLEVSEPTEEHVTSIDQYREVIDETSADKPFSQVSPVPLEDPMSFPEKPISVADLHTTENGDISDDTNSMTLSPNAAPHSATHEKRGINKDTEFTSHHVQQSVVSLASEERATSGKQDNTIFSNDKTVVEEKFYISGDNIPVKLEELNTMQDTPLLYKPVVASSQQKGLENSRETFYPSSTMSITKLTKVQATDSLPLGNLDHPSTNSYTKFYHIPMKMAFSSTGFIKNSKSKLDPALIIGETTTKMTDDSFIPDDILALSGNEVLSHDDAAFTEGLSNILGGGKHIASIEKSNMTSYGVISFMEDSSAESHGEFQVGENKVNNMDLTTIDLDQSTLECLSNEKGFYDGEEGKSPTIRKPTDIQGVLYRGIGSPLPFPSTHVTENPSEKNPVEPKYEQKYKVWFLRGRNSDSDNNGAFVQDLPAPFYNKPPKYMATHFLTVKNGKFFPKYSEDFTLKGDSMSRSEGGDTENIHTSDSEPMTAVGERRGFPSKTTGPTMKSTTGTGIKQLPGKRLSSTTFNVLWEAKATMSPKSEYNKNKASRTETYNSEDTTVPSFPVIINPDSRVPFAYDYSEAIILKESSSSSRIKKTNTATAITSLSPEERNEWSGAMPPDENARSGEYPLLRTTESMNICLEELTTDSALMSDKCLTDSSNLEPVPTDINEYIDLMDETDHQGSQVIRLQTGLYSLTLNSSFPHKTSANVIRKSINNHVDSSSTMERQNIMAEMPHSQDSHMPLAEFGVISNDEFSFIDDSEDLSNMASLPLSPMNAMQTLDNAIILATDSIYEGESMVPGDDYNSFQASLALQSSAKHGVVPDVSTEYLESSDPIASDFFTNTPAEWSDMFETTDYINFMNDEETVVIANSNVPFILPQATNSLKKLSWTPPMGHKTYPPNMSTTKASKVGMTVADHCAENILYIPRYESETSFEEDTTLNYEANLQNEESTKSEEEDTLEEENIKDYIYVVPVEDDYILKEDRLSTTHYSTNPDAHDTTTFRETIKPRAGQHGFENVISRPLLAGLNPQFQRKVIATISNSNSNHDGLFSDTTDRMIQENVPSIYTFTLETVPKFIRRDSSTPMKGNVHSGRAMKGISKPNLMASFNLVNVPKMPQNSIIISPYTSVLESKEGNDNSGTIVPIVEDIRPIGLKSLLIPRQKISRIEVPLGGKYMLSDAAVMLEVSEPTEEHVTSIDQNWEVIDETSADKPFSQVSPVPLEDPMSFPEKPISVADLHTTENGDISDDTNSMTLSPNAAPHSATHEKRGINKDTEFTSHHVQQSVVSLASEERATSGKEANTFFSNDKTVVEEKFYISGDNIPVNLEKLNTMQATPTPL